MSKQDVHDALADLETALSIISDNVVMPVSGRIYPFYKDAQRTLSIARKSLDGLHEHPYQEPKDYPEDPDPPTSCYCHATNFPPCSFCTREVDAK